MGWFLFILFVVCVGGCWSIARSIGRMLFPDEKDSGFIDRSINHITHVHHHHHEHKNITIIDDESRERILNLKDKQ